MDLNIDRPVILVFDEEELAASGTADSAVIDLSKTIIGSMTFQYRFTTASGAGVVDIELLESVNNSNWLLHGTKISTGISLAGAQDAIVALAASNDAPYIKIRITETGGVAGATLSVWLCSR